MGGSWRLLRGGSRGTCRFVALTVIKDGILAITKFTFLQDTLIKTFKVIFCKSIILEEPLNFIIDVLSKASTLVSVLDLEFVDQEALELFSLLDVEKSLSAGFTHLGTSS